MIFRWYTLALAIGLGLLGWAALAAIAYGIYTAT